MRLHHLLIESFIFQNVFFILSALSVHLWLLCWGEIILLPFIDWTFSNDNQFYCSKSTKRNDRRRKSICFWTQFQLKFYQVAIGMQKILMFQSCFVEQIWPKLDFMALFLNRNQLFLRKQNFWLFECARSKKKYVRNESFLQNEMYSCWKESKSLNYILQKEEKENIKFKSSRVGSSRVVWKASIYEMNGFVNGLYYYGISCTNICLGWVLLLHSKYVCELCLHAT